MKIYDCFIYFDEELLLDIRLNILNKYVDKFIIVESKFSHRGEPREPNFNINRYKKFQDKIEYILLDKNPENLFKINKDDTKINEKIIINGNLREFFQRNAIQEGLKNADEDDLIIISDVDEIPNLEEINFNKIENDPIFFNQIFCCFKLNLFSKMKWRGSRMIRKKKLISPQWLRDIKDRNYSKLRFDTYFSKKKYNNIKFINDGGWHFTNIRSPKELHYKLMNFGHHVDYKESGLNVEKIDKIMNSKKVLYDHSLDKTKNSWNASINLKRVENTILPSYLVNNVSKYKLWFDKNG